MGKTLKELISELKADYQKTKITISELNSLQKSDDLTDTYKVKAGLLDLDTIDIKNNLLIKNILDKMARKINDNENNRKNKFLVEIKNIVKDEKYTALLKKGIGNTLDEKASILIAILCGNELYDFGDYLFDIIEFGETLLSEDEKNSLVDETNQLNIGEVITPLDNEVADITTKILEIERKEKVEDLSLKTQEIINVLNQVNYALRSVKPTNDNIENEYDRIKGQYQTTLRNKYINEEFQDKFVKIDDYSLHFKDDVVKDSKTIQKFKNTKFELSNETKENLIKIWNKFDELNLYNEKSNSEEAKKVYGFSKLLIAREKVIEDVKKLDVNKLKDKSYQGITTIKKDTIAYNKEVANITTLYGLIENTIKPDGLSIPGNMSNFREDYIPPSLRKSLFVNNSFNGLYSTYAELKKNNINPKEFLENPVKVIEQLFYKLFENYDTNKIYKNDTPEIKTAKLFYNKFQDDKLDYTIYRLLENLIVCEKNEAIKEKDLLIVDKKMSDLFNNYVCSKYTIQGFFDKKTKVQTLYNFLVARNSDIIEYNNKGKFHYNDLYSGTSKSVDELSIEKPFNTKEYIINNKITPTEFYNKLVSFVQATYSLRGVKPKLEGTKEEYKNYYLDEDFIKLMKNVLKMVDKFIDDYDESIYDQEGITNLINLKLNPLNVFNGIESVYKNIKINDSYKANLSALAATTTIERETRVVEKAYKEIRKFEKRYNSIADKQLKRMEKVREKIFKETNYDRIERLENELRNLEQVYLTTQKDEINRLKTSYINKDIPKYYLNSRVDSILNGSHNVKISLGNDINKNDKLDNEIDNFLKYTYFKKEEKYILDDKKTYIKSKQEYINSWKDKYLKMVKKEFEKNIYHRILIDDKNEELKIDNKEFNSLDQILGINDETFNAYKDNLNPVDLNAIKTQIVVEEVNRNMNINSTNHLSNIEKENNINLDEVNTFRKAIVVKEEIEQDKQLINNDSLMHGVRIENNEFVIDTSSPRL